MTSIVVDLCISPEQFQRLYTGTARSVLVRARDGRRIRFPAQILRPFVTHEGVRGSFCVEFDQNHRFTHIKKLD
ncbi:MAG: DUF2835 domain-containing protein [Exilibacterium sp.]